MKKLFSKFSAALLCVAVLAIAAPIAGAGESYRNTFTTNLAVGVSSTVETNFEINLSGSTEVAFVVKYNMTTNVLGSSAGNLTLGWQRSADGSIFESGTNVLWNIPNNGVNYVTGFTNWNVGATDTLRLRSIANSSTNNAATNITIQVIKKQI